MVCRLHKALYGLKQAPRAWYTQLSQFFYLSMLMISFVTGTHPHIISSLISCMQKEFPVKDLGPLSYFLGIQVTRTSTGLHLCQSKYVAEILTKTHMTVPNQPNLLVLPAPSSLNLMVNSCSIFLPTAASWGPSNIVP
jgi:hypothetical protein